MYFIKNLPNKEDMEVLMENIWSACYDTNVAIAEVDENDDTLCVLLPKRHKLISKKISKNQLKYLIII